MTERLAGRYRVFYDPKLSHWAKVQDTEMNNWPVAEFYDLAFDDAPERAKALADELNEMEV